MYDQDRRPVLRNGKRRGSGQQRLLVRPVAACARDGDRVRLLRRKYRRRVGWFRLRFRFRRLVRLCRALRPRELVRLRLRLENFQQKHVRLVRRFALRRKSDRRIQRRRHTRRQKQPHNDGKRHQTHAEPVFHAAVFHTLRPHHSICLQSSKQNRLFPRRTERKNRLSARFPIEFPAGVVYNMQ